MREKKKLSRRHRGTEMKERMRRGKKGFHGGDRGTEMKEEVWEMEHPSKTLCLRASVRDKKKGKVEGTRARR